ncbi:MAG: phage integrase N-terminal SAM-like domain-containing protein [Candidatus Heimdallarchaeota archaeon]|nr:phage integrase N-terminal SAM-like domain-containing protein [Candidatus Heimdallarchaeota archaeon]
MISKLSRMTDEQLIEYYLKLKITLSKTTLRNYKVLLKQFSEFYVDRGSRIRDATQIDIGEFLNQFEYRSTKDTYRIILNIFFKWMFKHHLIDHNPLEEIRITNGKKNKQVLKQLVDILSMILRNT